MPQSRVLPDMLPPDGVRQRGGFCAKFRAARRRVTASAQLCPAHPTFALMLKACSAAAAQLSASQATRPATPSRAYARRYVACAIVIRCETPPARRAAREIPRQDERRPRQRRRFAQMFRACAAMNAALRSRCGGGALF